MQIVDAQIHLWGAGLPSNLAHRQVTAFTPEEAILLMDEGGVDAAVIHPPGWDRVRPSWRLRRFGTTPAGSRSWVRCRSIARNRARTSQAGENSRECSGYGMGS